MMKQLHVFLLAGQSNMAGRGDINTVEKLRHPDILVFKNDKWVEAEEPLMHNETSNGGIGLAMTIGLELLQQNKNIRIGFVPCAVSGSPLSLWMPGEDFYEYAVHQTKKALSGGKLAGILWHQGETDSKTEATANSYLRRFLEMINALKKELSADDGPVIVGELGEFLEQRRDKERYFETVNEALQNVPEYLPHSACVGSSGLSDKGDSLHFSAIAQRELGKRYAERYLSL